MRIRTAVAFYGLIFNSLFLCHFFVVLFLQGEYPVKEANAWIAGIEVMVTLVLAGLGIEGLLYLRERKKLPKYLWKQLEER